jgi:hypothetical protein
VINVKSHFTKIAPVLAVLLLSSSAFAAGGKESSVKGDKGGGGGGGGGSGGGGDIGGGGGPSSSDTGLNPNPDRLNGPVTNKKWEVGASFESHRLFIQNDLQGAGADKFFNYYDAYASWLPTKNDSLSLYFGVYQRFVADPNETGFRLDDLLLRYSHYFDLPAKVRLLTRASVYFPTSFASHKAGMIGAGRLTVGVEKLWGKYVLTRARVNGTGYWQQYNSPEGGGTPNEVASLSGSLELRVNMPFHTPLAIGLEGYTSYNWYLAANGNLPPGAPGVANDPLYQTQPIQQRYGGEIYVSYELPTLAGVSSEIHLAVAQGDPALGYNSALHDGISHEYFYWRESSEIYGSLLARF